MDCLSVFFPICPSVSLSVDLPELLTICLSISSSIYLSVLLSSYLSVSSSYPTMYECICVPFCFSVYPSAKLKSKVKPTSISWSPTDHHPRILSCTFRLISWKRNCNNEWDSLANRQEENAFSGSLVIKEEKSTKICHAAASCLHTNPKLSQAAAAEHREEGWENGRKEAFIVSGLKKTSSLLVKHCRCTSQFRAKVKLNQLLTLIWGAINTEGKWKELLLSWLRVYYTK